MKKIFLTILVASFQITSITNIFALTLEQALTYGYDYDEKFKLIKTEFLDEIESFPRALSEFMPRVSADISQTNIRTTPKVTNETSSNNRLTQSISLEQPLFNGFSSISKLEAARSAFKASTSNFYAKEQENFAQQINVYLSTVEAKEKYLISKVSVRSNKTQLEAMQERLRLGDVTETEVASAKEGLATAQSQEAQAYANYELTKADFERKFGVMAIDVAFPALPADLPKSMQQLIEEAAIANPSIGSAMHNTSSSESAAKAAKRSLLPAIILRAQYSNNEYERQTATNFDNTNTNASISVNIPILARGGYEYSEVRKAKYRTKKAAINHDSIIKQVRANSKASWSKYEATKLRVNAAQEAVRAAEKAYEGMMQGEIFGSKTIIDVLRAEERLNQARAGEIEAKKALIISAYEMRSLIGGLTAKAMNLAVEYFDPEAEFKKVKFKIIGF